jgi:superfamily II DNA or RNA helicase
MSIHLRPWQQEATTKALTWLLDAEGGKHFLINAAPGAGKTICASVIAQQLIVRGAIDRVIVIAPRAEVVNQWAGDFHRVTGRFMTKVTGRDHDVASMGLDVCATWAAVQGLLDALQAVCESQRTLVICDEHHHAAVEAAWGESADSAFHLARFVLVLTGTPIRSDGSQSVWLAYDDHGAITHPEAGSYTLTYGEAVDLAYCRPVTFHRHQARFTVDLKDGNVVQVAGDKPAELPADLKRIGGLQRALDFYRLACTPQFEKDGVTPLSSGYQATMVDWASAKLDELRTRLPNAGGLVIAPSIEMAEYMVDLIERIEGERPVLVHSQLPNPESRIRAFRNTDKRWLVSVAMVSEGVDIPRLRVLIYLPNALTELAFRQAIGRVVRTAGPKDDTRAYVVMPAFETFERYARKVEEEMSPSTRERSTQPKTKKCPNCESECPLGASHCECCGYEFPRMATRFKTCSHCGGLNPTTAATCQKCGKPFTTGFVLTLDEALRTGAIVRGLDLDEDAVKESEAMAAAVRQMVLKSGDSRLVRVLSTLPEESWARLRDILAAGNSAHARTTH